MTLETIKPREAAQRIRAGAMLVDIREPTEHAAERIEGAVNLPLGQLAAPIAGEGPIIFYCRSGQRTALNAAQLAACAGEREALVMGEGLNGWRAAGLPMARQHRSPLDIMRQVQIFAGGLILISALLAALVGPGFLLLIAAIGGGMLHAGLTGSCAMARLLAPLPWNRRSGPAQ